MLGGTYSQGTIVLDNGSVTASGVDVLWNDVLEGDELWPSGHGAMIIGADVVHPFDTITLLTPWPGTSLLGSTYVIVKTSWKRHDVTELQKLWRTLAAELEATGNFIFVEGDEPDPEMGENGQFALKTNIAPWRLWYKEVNVWVPQGVPVGSIWRGEWEAATTYQLNDVVERNGSSYISVTTDNLNKPPESNPDDWDLTSSIGDTGADGGVITIPYVFSTATGMADPGSGGLRLNNATQNAATALAIDLIDSRGLDFTSVLGSALGTTNPVRGHIRIHKSTDTAKFLTLAVSSETAPSGYRQYVCSVIGSSGATPFADLDPVLVNFARAGDIGPQGIQGIQGVQGPIGNPGGAIALPYVVDGLTTMDSNPGAGKMRFNASPQQAATVLRFNDTTALGAPVGNQFDAIATASASDTKVSGRVFVNGGTVPRLQFVVTAVEAKINYHNLTVAVISASVPDPFPDGAAIVVDWTPVGDKGDAATIEIGDTTTLAPGTPATVTNTGTVNEAVFDFGIPEGAPGQSFVPTYVVPDLAGRDDYDDEPEINVDGSRMSVLVESDSSNGGLPTLYFKQSDAHADWSGGILFQEANAAYAISYDNTASGYAATNVQTAIDENAAAIAAVDIGVPLEALAYGGMQINGSMDVSQELGTTGRTTAGYVCDGWQVAFGGTMTISAAQQASTAIPGFSNRIYVAISGAQSSLGSGDYLYLMQPVEGYRVARLAWGTASAQSVSIGFWSSNIPSGTYSVAVRNSAANRSYAATYTQAVSGTAQYNVITIPGDTTGTWAVTNTAGITVSFAMAAGSGFIAAAPNVWSAGNFVAAPGQVNGANSTSNLLIITGVTVIPGIYAPTAAQSPLIMRPFDQELATCKRYWEWVPYHMQGVSSSGSAGQSSPISFSVEKRVKPTTSAVAVDPGATSPIETNVASVAISRATTRGASCDIISTTSGSFYVIGYRFSADARL